MIFVTGGGGGLSPNNAVICVQAPAGSTITFSKGGVTVKVLGPDKAHVKASDNSLAEWFYSVSASNYGSWTITGTKGTDSTSVTVNVSANQEYEVVLSYKFVIISPSIMSLSALQGNTRITDDAAYSRITQSGDSYFVFNANGASIRGWQWKTLVNCAGYNYLVIRGYRNASKDVHFGFGNSLSASTTSINNIANGTLTTTSLNITTLDISTKNGSYYFGIYASPTCSVYVQEIYLTNTL